MCLISFTLLDYMVMVGRLVCLHNDEMDTCQMSENGPEGSPYTPWQRLGLGAAGTKKTLAWAIPKNV